MLCKRIIPCLDIKDGRVVKGVNFVGLRDAGDPVEVAKRYNDQGADELCFLDITATSDNRGIIYDIIASVAQLTPKPWVVGFAAETQNVESYAKNKLAQKKLDMIIANDVSNKNIGFNSENNAVTVISRSEIIAIEISSKRDIAEKIIALIAKNINAQQ